MFFSHASGSRIYDVDGNSYIDFTLSQGPLILGHSHPELLNRVQQELQKGKLYGGQFESEVELARRLVQIVPNAELVRFSNSGSEAVHAAIRLARAATGKSKILKFEGHYHGWFDNILISIQPDPVKAGPSEFPYPVASSEGQLTSLLSEVVVRNWNNLEAVRRVLEEDSSIAAIITEPVMCNSSCIVPADGYLEGLRELCDRFETLLIFDEVITGFRLALGGAQEYFGIAADLAAYGKAMASGFPISAIVGKREYMNHIAAGRVIHARTLNSNNACVAASLATIEVLSRGNPEPYRHLYRIGALLMSGIKEQAQRWGHSLLVQGPGPMFHTGFTPLLQVANYRETLSYDVKKLAQFTLGLLERGIRILDRGLWYVSLAHTEKDVEETLQATDDVLKALRP